MPHRSPPNGYQPWDGYDAGSGFAFAQEVGGWTHELDDEVLMGRRIAKRPRLRVQWLSRGKLPDALAMAGSGTFVSSVLRKVLETAAAAHIQFLPVTVPSGLWGQPHTGARRYHLVNVIHRVSCFDRKRSRYEIYDEPPHAIHALRKLVLTPIPKEAPPIFKIDEMPSVILIRDDLRQAMQELSASAGRFTPIGNDRRGA